MGKKMKSRQYDFRVIYKMVQSKPFYFRSESNGGSDPIPSTRTEYQAYTDKVVVESSEANRLKKNESIRK